MLKEAEFWQPYKEGSVRCLLCPRYCVIREGEVGFCRARINKEGKLYTRIWGVCAAIAIDPIEKKPLYHFYPRSKIFSIGTVGCNFSCIFCQNWHISQSKLEEVGWQFLSPEDAVNYSKRSGSIGIAYTYSEPIIWYEYVKSTSIYAKNAGLKNVLVTNGYINEEPLDKLLDYIDALNIDLKAYNRDFYKNLCSSSLEPVLKTIKLCWDKGKLVEVTNLIIPNHNDKKEDIEALIDWLLENCGVDIPLHFSRYFPHYKMREAPTPIEKLKEAYNLATSKLNFVYLGNIPEGGKEETTFCPSCKKALIIRYGYFISEYHLNNSNCAYCNKKIYLIA